MLSYILPRSLMTFVETEVTARVKRWASIADRQLDQMENELAERRSFSGLTGPTLIVPAVEQRTEEPDEPKKKKTK